MVAAMVVAGRLAGTGQELVMRVWIVGLFCALLGGVAVWKGATEGAWLFACGGVALVVASLSHIARPGRKSIGLIEVCWGVLIVGHAVRSGQSISFDSARSSGSSVAIIVAGILIIVGIINLARANRPPAKMEP
jgi:hypothetical protein